MNKFVEEFVEQKVVGVVKENSYIKEIIDIMEKT